MSPCPEECDMKCDSHEGLILGLASLRAKVITGGIIAGLLVGFLITFVVSVFDAQQALESNVAKEFKRIDGDIYISKTDVSLINQSIESLNRALLYNRKILISIAEHNKVKIDTTSMLTFTEDY